MTPDAVAAQVALWIQTTYPTGIGWLERGDGTVTVDWVDDSSTTITITVRNVAAPNQPPGIMRAKDARAALLGEDGRGVS